MTPALQTLNLSVRLSNQTVLRGLDISIPAAQWTCIVGPNGAGKSTLLKAMANLLPARTHSGKVLFFGQTLVELPINIRAQKLAWLGQNQSCADDTSVFDLVMLGRLPHQNWLAAPNAADHSACESALRRTHAWDWRTRRMGTLSGGERQRVLLARLLAVEAQVLLMDEPLAHLDPPHQADWLAIVRTLIAQGKTVVSVLHELTTALQADQLLVLAAGTVHHVGSTQDAATHSALSAAFGGRIALHPLAGRWVALPQ